MSLAIRHEELMDLDRLVSSRISAIIVTMKDDFFKKLVQQAVQDLFGLGIDAHVERPKDLSHGDYATNAALLVSKQLGKPPIEVATELAAYLDKTKESFVASVTVAGPGFINFTISRSHNIDAIREAMGTSSYGYTNVYAGKKILVEHSSPNLFKPFHIGHLMNNTIGEAITRLARTASAQVSTMSFPSDISLGVAKAIYVLLEKYGANFVPDDVAVLGDAYVEGTRRYQEAQESEPCGSMVYRVKEIADNLYAKKPSEELTVFESCKAFNITYFEQIVSRLGSQFDSYIYESEAGVDGGRIVRENTPTVFRESEGAIVYTPENPKLHTAVFINSQGNPTYEAKDIGLLDLKFTRYDPDLSIFITDAQQVSHFAVVLDAAQHINPAWVEKSLHRYHGRMSFKGQKMSSRLGGVPLASEVLDTVIAEVKEKNPDISPEAAEQIGVASIKFSILRAAAGKNIDFDPEVSLSFVGDSGPYIQYTCVRASSLLEKGKEAGVLPDASTPQAGTELIERLVAKFPEVMILAQRELAPHHLVTYTLELAQAFNSWYGQGKIVDEDTHASAYRLAVVKAVRQTLTNGLWVLGIEIPERM